MCNLVIQYASIIVASSCYPFHLYHLYFTLVTVTSTGYCYYGINGMFTVTRHVVKGTYPQLIIAVIFIVYILFYLYLISLLIFVYICYILFPQKPRIHVCQKSFTRIILPFISSFKTRFMVFNSITVIQGFIIGYKSLYTG